MKVNLNINQNWQKSNNSSQYLQKNKNQSFGRVEVGVTDMFFGKLYEDGILKEFKKFAKQIMSRGRSDNRYLFQKGMLTVSRQADHLKVRSFHDNTIESMSVASAKARNKLKNAKRAYLRRKKRQEEFPVKILSQIEKSGLDITFDFHDVFNSMSMTGHKKSLRKIISIMKHVPESERKEYSIMLSTECGDEPTLALKKGNDVLIKGAKYGEDGCDDLILAIPSLKAKFGGPIERLMASRNAAKIEAERNSEKLNQEKNVAVLLDGIHIEDSKMFGNWNL